jgi:hypothetical protein
MNGDFHSLAIVEWLKVSTPMSAWTYYICPKATKIMMIAPRTSAQLEIGMPAIDVFWLNHSMTFLPREAASVGDLFYFNRAFIQWT